MQALSFADDRHHRISRKLTRRRLWRVPYHLQEGFLHRKSIFEVEDDQKRIDLAQAFDYRQLGKSAPERSGRLSLLLNRRLHPELQLGRLDISLCIKVPVEPIIGCCF
jgi:hypothetical protein